MEFPGGLQTQEGILIAIFLIVIWLLPSQIFSVTIAALCIGIPWLLPYSVTTLYKGIVPNVLLESPCLSRRGNTVYTGAGMTFQIQDSNFAIASLKL